MIYLHVIEACLKVIIAMFIFTIPIILEVLWKIVLIPSLKICCLKTHSDTIFNNWKSFKNDEKYFLFNPKSSFRSQDI